MSTSVRSTASSCIGASARSRPPSTAHWCCWGAPSRAAARRTATASGCAARCPSSISTNGWRCTPGSFHPRRARHRRPRARRAAAGALALNGIELETGRLDVFGRLFNDLKVAAQRSGGDDWRLRLTGREVEGTAVWRAPASSPPNGRVTARLARFVPPGPDQLHPARSEVASPDGKAKNTWPELDIVADAFVSRGNDLGTVRTHRAAVGRGLAHHQDGARESFRAHRCQRVVAHRPGTAEHGHRRDGRHRGRGRCSSRASDIRWP